MLVRSKSYKEYLVTTKHLWIGVGWLVSVPWDGIYYLANGTIVEGNTVRG